VCFRRHLSEYVGRTALASKQVFFISKPVLESEAQTKCWFKNSSFHKGFDKSDEKNFKI